MAALDVSGCTSALDLALAAEDGPGTVARFVNAVAPDEVRAAVRRCLPPDAGDVVPHLVRAKLKPGRKLTAEYEVRVPSARLVRRISATWVSPGAPAPGPAPEQAGEARRRGVLAPFHRSWVASDDERMSLSVSPVDGAFPQLVRLHDRVHLRGVLRAVPGWGAVAADDVTVRTVRYRPGQRHVLRVEAPGTGSLFAKVYRDGTGWRAVDAAGRVAAALRAGDGQAAVSAGAGMFVPADRVVLWPEVAGGSLGGLVAESGAQAAEAVGSAGYALRLVHDGPCPADLPACPDAVRQAEETLRTAQLVDVLLPPVGARLRRGVDRALTALARLPAGPPTSTHGDYKCDNLLVGGSGLHLLDFDRSGRGDPAADVGKFLADLRWWSDGDGPVAAWLSEAFLSGYGSVPGQDRGRAARARAYDPLFQLRMAARRVPVQDPDWEHRVTRAVGIAEATLAGESPP